MIPLHNIRRSRIKYLNKFISFSLRVIILIFITNFAISSPQKTKVDSLLSKLEESNNDLDKVKILIDLGSLYQRQSYDSATHYLKKSLILAQKSGLDKYTAISLGKIGFINVETGKLTEAEKLLKDALEISTRLNDKHHISLLKDHIGILYWKRGNFKKAITHLLEALKLSESIDDKISISNLCNDLGILYWEQKDFKKSLKYYQKALEIRRKLNDQRGIAQSYNNIGIIHYSLGDKKLASEFYLKSLSIANSLNYSSLISLVQCNLGETYTELGEFKKANLHFSQGLKMARETNNHDAEATLLIHMAISEIIQKRYEKSIEHGLMGLLIAKKYKSLRLEKMAYENLALANKKLKKFRESLEYYKKFKELNDSIFNEANSRQIVEMETKYETEKKTRENELLKKDNDLQQLIINKETNFRNFLIIIVGLIMVLAILLYNKIRNKKKNEKILSEKVKLRTQELEKAKEIAEENDRLKSAFLANISHEIRTPMNGIMGFADLLKNSHLPGEKQKMFIDKIEKSGDRMITIINNLVDISKVESGQMTISKTEIRILDELQEIYNLFKDAAMEKGLDFTISKPSYALNPSIQTDREKFQSILKNLLNNAIKFTLEGRVSLGFELKDNELQFFVEDSGIGIPNEKKDVVFERFIQADLAAEKEYDGAGLGLSITKAYVEILGGKIWVKSEYKVGSKFYFTLPYEAA